MKKYFNNKNEQLKLEKGTIAELKDYEGRTQVYLTQDEQSKKWHATLAQAFLLEDGTQVWNTRVPYGAGRSVESVAYLLEYYYDEAGDMHDFWSGII